MMKKMKNLLTITMMFLFVALAVPSMNTEAASTIKLNKTSVTLYKHQTTKLKLTGTKQKITWGSTKKRVATVTKKGKVTAKKAGKAVITAKIKNGKKTKTYKCAVTVKNPYISQKTMDIRIGEPGVLKLYGAKIQSATSSNTGIATVDTTGRVIGHNVGTATITLTGVRGAKYTCTVNVGAAVKDYTGFDHWGDGYVYDPNQNGGLKAFDMDFPYLLYTVATYNGQVGFFMMFGDVQEKGVNARMDVYEAYPEYTVSWGAVPMGLYNGVAVGWQGFSKP